MNAPLVLDFDHSVGPLAGRKVLSLGHWQEALRFGCRLRTLRRFERELDALLLPQHGTVLLGSGDFHHLSWPLVARAAARLPAGAAVQVVVLDNHPDNMRYAPGVHCGSWVRQVASLPRVNHVHVIGIASADAGTARAWQNYLAPLRRGRLSYWCLGVDVRWAWRCGLGAAVRSFDDPAALIDAVVAALRGAAAPVYLSIDKDVFAPEVARTNWDQGRLRLEHALALIGALPGPLAGSDITGEVSQYRYRSLFKRVLSALDGQPAVDGAQLADWQAQQHRLNIELLRAIDALPVV
jgi:hypothetical protein